MSYLNTEIQYYEADIRKTKPIGTCTLGQLFESIRNPKGETLGKFDLIAKASREGNKKLKDELKASLYYFTPCIFSDGTNRTYDSILRWTGVLILDFDNLEQELAVELRDYLFDNYPFVIASMLSSSRKGVKAVVRIPVVKSVEEFKSYFYGLAEHMQWIKGWDMTGQNSSLAFYLTYDYDIKVREDAVEWLGRGFKEDEFKEWSGGEIEPLEDVTEEDREEILLQLKRCVDRIVDSGHAFYRSTCLLGWGFAGAGYFTEDEMKEILFDLVDDNDYLSQKPRTYKKTCLDMKRVGFASPVYLERHEHLYE